MARVTSRCLRLVDKLPETGPFEQTKMEDIIEELKEECLKSKYGFRDHRRTGPVSPRQAAWREKFKEIAKMCKGSSNYRACMKEKLSKSKV